MLFVRRLLPLSSFILETRSSTTVSNHLVLNPNKIFRMASTNAQSRYEIVERGQLNTLSYRCYFRDAETKAIISPFHDIPLVNSQYTASSEQPGTTVYNMVVEVPRWTNAKMEITKKLKMNPLSQDVKNGKPRFVHNIFPYHGYLWNYGALPQTWEDPNHVDNDTKTVGDNDPLDVCEIGTALHPTGSVVPVKIVGVLGLIDEGETDWKLIGIDVRDKLAPKINDITDVETHFPGLLDATRRWFKFYKVPTGKPPNSFALNEQYADRTFAKRVIDETRKYWENLVSGQTKVDEKGLSIANTSLKNSSTINAEDANKLVEAEAPLEKEPAKIDASVHLVSYV